MKLSVYHCLPKGRNKSHGAKVWMQDDLENALFISKECFQVDMASIRNFLVCVDDGLWPELNLNVFSFAYDWGVCMNCIHTCSSQGHHAYMWFHVFQ